MKGPLSFAVALTPAAKGSKVILEPGTDREFDLSPWIRGIEIHNSIDDATTIRLEFVYVQIGSLADATEA